MGVSVLLFYVILAIGAENESISQHDTHPHAPVGRDPFGSHRMDPCVCMNAVDVMYTDTAF
jgi:hypothetical protein